MSYYRRRADSRWGRNPALELILTAVVVVLVVAVLVLFLFVYHDIPLRVP
jgi:heme/copper-type cytochrome/quinol oxidase subunit 2